LPRLGFCARVGQCDQPDEKSPWDGSPLRVVPSLATRTYGALRLRFAQLDEQDLGILPSSERNRTLGDDSSAIAGGQKVVAKGDLSMHDVNPGAAP
jgi:hypothetical protein